MIRHSSNSNTPQPERTDKASKNQYPLLPRNRREVLLGSPEKRIKSLLFPETYGERENVILTK
jgi:hypothetical protein